MTAHERMQMLGAALAFAAVGGAMVFYEVARLKQARPIWGGGDAVQAYWVAYCAMFVLAFVFVIAVLVR
jgi:hypothetical protein